MGTRKDSFIMFGWRLPYEAFAGQDYDEMEIYHPQGGYGKPFKFHDDFTLISDGMSGKWVMLGTVLHSTNGQGDFDVDDGVLQLAAPNVLNYAPMLYSAEEFVRNKNIDVKLTTPPRLFLVEHFH